MNLIPLLALFVSLTSPLSAEENWTEFRGPNGAGHSKATSLPTQWSESQSIRWKTAIPGKGWSSPVIWKDQIWLTTATDDGKQMFVVALSKKTGKILTNQLVFENAHPESIHEINSYASPTPAIEEGRVFIHFGTYGTACYDTRSFKQVWARRDIHCQHQVGPGSSPILYGNTVILTIDGMDVQYLLALDKKTGHNVWKTTRSIDLLKIDMDRRKAFTTPVLTEASGQPLLISVGGHAAYAYDPRDGREVWVYRSMGFSGSCRPLLGNGIVYMNVGFGEYESLRAVRLGGVGDITQTHTAWKYNRNVPNKPSMLLVDDLLYFVNDDGGMISCLEAKTGKEVWKERVGGKFSASPLYANGVIYLFDEAGRNLILKPGRTFQRLQENRLDAGCMATPAVSGNALYIRTKTHLYRVE